MRVDAPDFNHQWLPPNVVLFFLSPTGFLEEILKRFKVKEYIIMKKTPQL